MEWAASWFLKNLIAIREAEGELRKDYAQVAALSVVVIVATSNLTLSCIRQSGPPETV